MVYFWMDCKVGKFFLIIGIILKRRKVGVGNIKQIVILFVYILCFYFKLWIIIDQVGWGDMDFLFFRGRLVLCIQNLSEGVED